ncbi:MAG: response regulator transcription factor [Sphingobacteriales bacterium]|jgi:DNA-binding NarL/FixJ family response regulator|nr:response regulator transcription factor [Sphingobacteriales bacterium]
MIKLALIEDNKALRDNYVDYLTMTGSFEVLWTFDSIEEVIKTSLEEPRVILLDVNLVGMSAVEGFHLIKEKFPKSIIIILTAYDTNDYVKELLKKGAHGYLLKSVSMSEIHRGIESVLDGGFSISPHAAKHLIAEYRHDPIEDMKEKLTKREFELVKLLSEGLTYNEAADRLFVTSFTINQHLKHIYLKLGVKSKAELMSKMIK